MKINPYRFQDQLRNEKNQNTPRCSCNNRMLIFLSFHHSNASLQIQDLDTSGDLDTWGNGSSVQKQPLLLSAASNLSENYCRTYSYPSLNHLLQTVFLCLHMYSTIFIHFEYSSSSHSEIGKLAFILAEEIFFLLLVLNFPECYA